MKLTYKILMNKEPEGVYTVTVPALPGCVTFGETPEHAIEMAKEAIDLYIEELKRFCLQTNKRQPLHLLFPCYRKNDQCSHAWKQRFSKGHFFYYSKACRN